MPMQDKDITVKMVRLVAGTPTEVCLLSSRLVEIEASLIGGSVVARTIATNNHKMFVLAIISFEAPTSTDRISR
jgi:hypothetical protein